MIPCEQLCETVAPDVKSNAHVLSDSNNTMFIMSAILL